MRPVRRHRSEGFSLIAVSILLTVAAIILASVLPEGDDDYNQQVIKNMAKIDKVEEAMRSYMVANGHRPCPADGQYTVGDANFGLQAVNGGCQNGTPAAPLGPDSSTGRIVSGVIPTRSLGLPDDYAFDAWGRRFTYAVDIQAVNTPTCLDMQHLDTEGSLQINNSAGTAIAHTMYTYISHGPDGHGAFPAQGSNVAGRINIGTTDVDTLRNASVDSSFTTSFSATRVKKDRTTMFDDLVYYREDLKNTCCIGALCTAGPGFRIDGQVPAFGGGKVGWTSATADINDDGITDLILGANTYDNTGSSSGAVYVIYGKSTGLPTSIDPYSLDALDGTNGFRMDGLPFDIAGSTLAIGDINEDGKPDIIIGAFQANGGVGAVYVVFGGATKKDTTAWTTNSGVHSLSTTAGNLCDGTNGFRILGVEASGEMGSAVATGDVNGDGHTDILMGAMWPGGGVGYTYVVFGGGHDGGGAAIRKNGTAWTASQTVATAGVLINGTNGIRIDGVAGNDFSASSLATGDIDGDSIADIIIGAIGPDPGALNAAGSVYVVYGGATRKDTASWLPTQVLNTGASELMDGINGFRLDGAGAGDMLGTMLRTGDFNNDGKTDIISAAQGTDSGRGSVYVVFGGGHDVSNIPLRKDATPWLATQTVSTGVGNLIDGTNGIRIDGGSASEVFGWDMAMGDVNADGIRDLVVSAPWGNSETGYVYAIFGGTTRKDGTAWAANGGVHSADTTGGNLADGRNGFRLNGVVSGDKFGRSVAVGDFNNNGIADIIGGAPWGTASGRFMAGYVYVYYGHGGLYTSPYNMSNLCTGVSC